MATRNVSIRLGLENQEAVTRGLNKVGDDGKAALGKIDSALKSSTQASNAHTGAVKLQAHQIGNLNQQLIDIGVGLQGGQNPFTVMTQQMPQVVFAVGGLRNAMSLLGQAFTPLRLAIGGTVGGLAALATGVALAGLKISENESEARQFNATIRAMGLNANTSAGQLRGLVEAMREIDGVGLADARGALGAALLVPGVTEQGLGAVSRLAGDFAAAYGGGVADAAQKIAQISASGIEAIEKLDAATGFLTAEQLRNARALAEQGDKAGAVKIAMDALAGRIDGLARDSMSDFGRASTDAGAAWDDFKTSLAESGFGDVAIGTVNAFAAAIRGIGSALGSLAESGESVPEPIMALIDPLGFRNLSGRRRNTGQSINLDLPSQALDASVKNSAAEAQQKIVDGIQKEVDLQREALGLSKDQADLLIAENRARKELSAKGLSGGILDEAVKARAELVRLGQQRQKQTEAERGSEAAAKKAAEDRAKEIDEGYQKRKRVNDLVRKERADELKQDQARNKSLDDYLRGLGREAELAGLSTDEKQVQLALDEARKRLGLEINQTLEDEVAMQIRASVERVNGIEAAKKATEELDRQWEKFTDDIKESLTDSIVRGLEDGKPAIKVFFDTLRRAALTAAIKIPVDLVVNAASGIAQGALASASGNVGGSIAGQIAQSLGLKAVGSSLTSSLFGTGAVGAAGPQIPTAGLLGSGGITGTAGMVASGAGLAIAALGIARAAGFIGPKPTVGANAGGRFDEAGGRFFITGVGEDRNKGVSQRAAVQSVLDGAQLAINSFVEGAGLLDQQIGDGVREAVQLFASGKNPINITVESLTKAMLPYVEGLTDAQRATIAATGGLDGLTAVMNELAAQKALPAELAATRLSLENPKQFAIDALNIETEGLRERARALTDGTQALADIEFIYQHQLAEINKQFATSIGDAFSQAIEIAGLRLTAANDNLNRASSVLTKAVEAERAGVTGRYNAALKTSQTALDGLTKAAQRLTSIAALLKNAIPDIPGQEGPNRRAGQATLSAAMAAARAGGVLPDEDTLRTALDAVAKPSEGLFSTFLDYQRDFIRTANDISDLSDVADWQRKKADLSVTTATDALEQDRLAYEAELTRLDGILSNAQAQIDAVNGTTIAVMSVEDAIRELAAALLASKSGAGAVAAANPVNSLYQGLLGRGADSAGGAHFNAALASGQSTVDVAQNIIRSPEFAATHRTVESLYSIFGSNRAPDAEGVAYWTAQLASGAQSLQEIALNFTRGEEYADLVAVRGYASGGYHPGGLRVVGERGPELEFTGPSRIFSNSQSAGMLDNSAVVTQLQDVKSRLERLDAALVAIAVKTTDQEARQRKWDSQGLPPTRAA